MKWFNWPYWVEIVEQKGPINWFDIPCKAGIYITKNYTIKVYGS